ncbi:hypothetical protein [Corynebacterium sphenisci]|uniref:hypothetical protein n=1 Tax=Corynebacterium sphenisci TaxID=191493 RepID=UPI0026DF01B2|nr:hypothetical protein [Corynebacterium sphenisci]MDO5731319.1 hypothetical protein [Corynebacterium sphenisci]
MIRPVTAPYLVPDPEALEMTEWQLIKGEDTEPLGAYVPDWTTGNDIQLSRSAQVDPERVREECRLPADARLGLAVSWMGNSSKIRQRVSLIRCTGERAWIRVRLPGDRLGGTVEVATSLVLLDDVASPEVGAPHRAGSILVRDVVTIALEGDGSMFPMAVADFRGQPFPDDASWFVRTSTNPDANFSGTFQVLVNEMDTALVAAIEAEKPNREQAALLDQMSSAVIETVLDLAYQMRARGDLDGTPREEGSVGDVLEALIGQTCGGGTFDELYEYGNNARRRAVFQGMARRLGAGRMFRNA